MANKKILIVEDDKDLHRVLNVRLRASGYDTCIASDAYQALAVGRTEKPDVILLDLGLPAGGGYSVLERIQDIPSLACIPVIVISARDRLSNEPQSLKAVAVAFLQKPVSSEELLRTIRQALGDTDGST